MAGIQGPPGSPVPFWRDSDPPPNRWPLSREARGLPPLHLSVSKRGFLPISELRTLRFREGDKDAGSEWPLLSLSLVTLGFQAPKQLVGVGFH